MDAQSSREFKGFKVLVGRATPVILPPPPPETPSLFSFPPCSRDRRIRREVEEIFREANGWRRTGH